MDTMITSYKENFLPNKGVSKLVLGTYLERGFNQPFTENGICIRCIFNIVSSYSKWNVSFDTIRENRTLEIKKTRMLSYRIRYRVTKL